MQAWLAGAGKQDGVAGDQRLIGEVLRHHGLADTVGADQHYIGGVVEEVERHERLDGGTVAAFRPGPVEVAERFEAADMRVFQPPFQAVGGGGNPRIDGAEPVAEACPVGWPFGLLGDGGTSPVR